MKIFDSYSNYYDLLYKDKNYNAEADYVIDLIHTYSDVGKKSILDLGCGTGKHAARFEEMGFRTVGVDISKTMLDKANKSYPSTEFVCGDVRDVRIDRKFDVIVSLFHVVSYLNQNDDLMRYFETASYHLSKDGLLIFDFWYGPSVLIDPPSVRVKRCKDDGFQLTRIAEPFVSYNKNTVDVSYEIFIIDSICKCTQIISEKHIMRYFFLPELILFLSLYDFKILAAHDWLSFETINEKGWYGCVIAKKN